MNYIVYTFWGVAGTPLYVGATCCLARRIEEHRLDKPWFTQVQRIEQETFATVSEASEREQYLIKTRTPRYNVSLSPYGHVPLVLRMPPTNDVGMTLTEAATYTGLSAATLRTQVKAGIIPHTRAGKLYLVDVRDLDAYVREYKGKHGFASPRYPHKPKEAP